MKYVLGHRNPDTDSIVSAVVMADFLGEGYIGAKSGALNKETEYIFDRFGISKPEFFDAGNSEAFVLVDHNQEAQMPEGVDRLKIEAIVDHHNLGGLALPSTIYVRIEPTGCTATIIAKMYEEAGREIPKPMASLLLAAIVSDTVKFKSPTSTKEDEEAAEGLAVYAGLDIDDLASGMFKAKSDLTGTPVKEILNTDYKNYKMGAEKVGIGVFETVDPSAALARKEEIIAALKAQKKDETVDYIYFGIVDIINGVTHFVILTDKEKELAESVFGGKTQDQILEVPGAVSRKKQMVPPLEKALS